ncbi:MAG: transposase [Pirellulales bacterium]
MKFYDAQDSDGKRAAQMLALVGELYAIEREAKGADDDVRLALRRERSLPVLAKIKDWLETEAEVVLPRSPMAAAIGYAKNQWAALVTYTTQGYLAIDNNAAERALNRVAIGRKNWLFAGHDAAAANQSRLWSLIATAELAPGLKLHLEKNSGSRSAGPVRHANARSFVSNRGRSRRKLGDIDFVHIGSGAVWLHRRYRRSGWQVTDL